MNKTKNYILRIVLSCVFFAITVIRVLSASANEIVIPILDSDNGEFGYRLVNGVDLYNKSESAPESVELYSKKTGERINAYSYRGLLLNTLYTDDEGVVQTPFKSDEISMSTWVKVDDMVEMARTDQGLEIFSLRWKNDIANNTISVTANQRGRIQLTARGVDSEQVQLVKNSSTGIVSEKVRFPLFTTETEALYESNGDVIASAFDDTGDFAQFTVTRGFNADTNTYTLKLYINAELTHIVELEIPEGTKHDTTRETLLLFGGGGGGRLPLTATYAHTKVYTNELSQEQVTKLYEDTRDDFYEEGLRFELGVNNHTTPDLINKLGYQPITRYTANVGSRTMNRVVGTNPFTGEEYAYIDDLAHSASIPAKNIIEKDMTFETWLRPGAFSAGGTMPIFSVAGNGTSRPTLYLGITSQGTLMLETNQTEQLYNGVGTISPSPGTIASNEAAGATVEDRPWVHIAITRSWDENTRSYTYFTYVDGELKGTITEEFVEDAQPLDESGLYAVLNGKYAVNSINSGGNEGTVYWRMDNSYMGTKIYGRALTADEIKDEYESNSALLADNNELTYESIALLDENKKLTEDIEDITKVYAQIKAENNTGKENSATIILSGYDAVGRLIITETESAKLPANEYGRKKLVSEKYIDLIKYPDVYKIKAFLWSDLNGLMPLVEPVEGKREKYLEMLAYETFSDNNLSQEWITAGGEANFVINNDALDFQNSSGGMVMDNEWYDYKINTNITLNENSDSLQKVYLYVRYKNYDVFGERYYLVGFDGSNTITILKKSQHDKSETELCKTFVGECDDGKPKEFNVKVIDNNIIVYLNGNKVLEYTDNQLPLLSGGAGILINDGDGFADDFCITSIYDPNGEIYDNLIGGGFNSSTSLVESVLY